MSTSGTPGTSARNTNKSPRSSVTEAWKEDKSGSTAARLSQTEVSTASGASGEDVAPSLSDQVNTVKDALVDQLGVTAEKIKALSPKGGALSRLGSTLEDGLSRSESYLRDRTAADLASDLVSLVRRYPFPIAFGAVGAGIGAFVTKQMKAGDKSKGSSVSTPAKSKAAVGVPKKSQPSKSESKAFEASTTH